MDIENAEMILQGSNQAEFSLVREENNNCLPYNISNKSVIADDLAFIMQNAALHDSSQTAVKVLNIESSSSSSSSDESDSDSDSEVKIVDKPNKPTTVTICISSDDDNDEDKKDIEEQNINHKVIQERIDNGLDTICQKLLTTLVKEVVQKERLEKGEESSSEEDDDENNKTSLVCNDRDR